MVFPVGNFCNASFRAAPRMRFSAVGLPVGVGSFLAPTVFIVNLRANANKLPWMARIVRISSAKWYMFRDYFDLTILGQTAVTFLDVTVSGATSGNGYYSLAAGVFKAVSFDVSTVTSLNLSPGVQLVGQTTYTVTSGYSTWGTLSLDTHCGYRGGAWRLWPLLLGAMMSLLPCISGLFGLINHIQPREADQEKNHRRSSATIETRPAPQTAAHSRRPPSGENLFRPVGWRDIHPFRRSKL